MLPTCFYLMHFTEEMLDESVNIHFCYFFLFHVDAFNYPVEISNVERFMIRVFVSSEF
jgi:hypothetical protein